MKKVAAVRMSNISKRFGNVQALDNVDLELYKGEILGLVGDNAAGKSTLMKILSGAVKQDNGKICVFGDEVRINNSRDARQFGIEMIYQDLALCNNLNVASNIFLGREYTKKIIGLNLFLDKKKIYSEADSLIKKLNINISSPKLKVEKMSGGQRQMVAAARSIAFESKILIMDEPTAALGVKEANTLLKLIKELRDQGLSIILITQRVPDVLKIGDRVMVLKGGEKQGVLEVNKVSLDDIVDLIIKGKPSDVSDNENYEYLTL